MKGWGYWDSKEEPLEIKVSKTRDDEISLVTEEGNAIGQGSHFAYMGARFQKSGLTETCLVNEKLVWPT